MKSLLKQVGINPTRTGILDVLIEMGASIQEMQIDQQNQAADLMVRSANLQSVRSKEKSFLA